MALKIDLFDTKTILYQLAAAQAIGYATSIVLSEGRSEITDGLFWLALVRGLLFGSAVSFALARVARDLAGIQKKKAFWIAVASGTALLIVSPAVMAPGVHSVIPANFLPEDWQKWTFAIALAVAADLAAVAIAATGDKLQVVKPLPKQEPAPAPAPAQQPVPPAPPVAPEPAPVAEPQVVFMSKMAEQVKCEFCQQSGTRGWANGHKSFCPENPVNKQVPA